MPHTTALPKQEEKQDGGAQLLCLDAIAQAPVHTDPFPHLIARNVLSPEAAPLLARDFPRITKPGFFPLSMLKREGAFDALLTQIESSMAAVLTEKLGVELRDKPHMITIRKWSAAKDGRIHNDGKSKIVTCLFYLNETWPTQEDGGRFRILRSDKSFDDTVAEVPPDFGNFAAFVRTENSWHGHKPFAGERRVIQMTWLHSWDDLKRKEKQGRLSFLLKRLLPASY